MKQPLEVLRRYWGYEDFRPGQLDIITSILKGKDTLALLPTGGGKSICYQIPAICKEGVCLVISPLIALMADQVSELRKRGFKAEDLSGTHRPDEVDRKLDNCRFGYSQFLFLSPERLKNEELFSRISELPISFLTVDEAHCISEWGYDFRPAYLDIGELKRVCPHIPVLALTATAPPRVTKDIQARLHFSEENLIRRSFHRPNLAYRVRYTNNPVGDLFQLLYRNQGSCIIYVRSRRNAEMLAATLKQKGHSALAYHAGLDIAVRHERQQLWMKDQNRIMVATTAFGMGINKGNVRQVIHWTMPESPEAYFQEAGRAGRDGENAICTVLVRNEEVEQWYEQKKREWPDDGFLRTSYDTLCQLGRIALGEGKGIVFHFSWTDLKEKMACSNQKLRRGLDLLQQCGLIHYSLEGKPTSTFHFTHSPERLYESLERQESLLLLAKQLGRSYNGIFGQQTRISEGKLASFMECQIEEVKQGLRRLHALGAGIYAEQHDKLECTLIEDRLAAKYLRLNADFLKSRKRQFFQQLESVRYFAEDNQLCRSVKLLDYLGEPNPKNCGSCDVCLSSSRISRREIREAILQIASDRKLDENWWWNFPFHLQHDIIQEVRHMVDEGLVELPEN